eukprot:6292692-Lingulodinium_polyedra.AAC.1
MEIAVIMSLSGTSCSVRTPRGNVGSDAVARPLCKKAFVAATKVGFSVSIAVMSAMYLRSLSASSSTASSLKVEAPF